MPVNNNMLDVDDDDVVGAGEGFPDSAMNHDKVMF
jgi:hypothetical protein